MGLGELGTGIQTLVAAPLTGTGTGLSSLAGGVRDVAETFGDLGRGLSDLFSAIPKLPGASPAPPGIGPGEGFNGGGGGTRIVWPAVQPLIPDSGGSKNTLLAGGGGAVILPVITGPRPGSGLVPSLPSYTPPPPDIRLRPTQIYTRNRDIVML